MPTALLRFDGAVERDPAVERWFAEREGKLVPIARVWFAVMRNCGDEVRELVHDGCPVACFGDVPFAYVNVYTRHVNVGFFQGARLRDPAALLQGVGKFMRHVKIVPAEKMDDLYVRGLIEAAYEDIRLLVENGH